MADGVARQRGCGGCCGPLALWLRLALDKPQQHPGKRQKISLTKLNKTQCALQCAPLSLYQQPTYSYRTLRSPRSLPRELWQPCSRHQRGRTTKTRPIQLQGTTYLFTGTLQATPVSVSLRLRVPRLTSFCRETSKNDISSARPGTIR